MGTIICYRLLQFHKQPLRNSRNKSHETLPLQMGLSVTQMKSAQLLGLSKWPKAFWGLSRCWAL